jgi:hypothetical protein
MSTNATAITTAAILASLTPEQQQAMLARALENTPACFVDLFYNHRRREGHNDAHYTGRMDLNIARLKAVIAEAEGNGWRNVQMYFDLRVQHDGSESGPLMRGWAKNVVPVDKRFEPTPRLTVTPPGLVSVTPAGPASHSTADTPDDRPF